MNDYILRIALTNLGQYNAGILNYTWLSLPATDEEIAAAFDKIHVCHDDIQYTDSFGCPYEEYFITDYECDFYDVGEFENINKLNELAEEVAGLDDYEKIILKALLSDGMDLDEAMEQKDNCFLYDGCDSMTEVAERYVDETDLLHDVPDDLKYYFDFEAFGRNMSFENHFISYDNGYVEVLR